MIQLTWWSLEDLFTQWSPGNVPPTRIALLINLPSSDERPLLLEHLLHEAGRSPGVEDETGLFLRGLRPLLMKGLEQADLQVLQAGHAGVWVGLQRAAALLETGRVDVCLVGGVDSYLDGPTLEWLDATRKLKTPERPVGLMPGEGAAFLAVEKARTARARGLHTLAQFGPLSMGEEPGGYGDGDFRPLGVELASVLVDSIQRNPTKERDISVLLMDLNGQEARAMDWGHALVRCASAVEKLGRMRQWIPASSFGDVGGATAAFLMCIAVRAFSRGYALGHELLLSCCSEQGLRGALILKAPGSRSMCLR
ncbi:hypothetical protein KYC5002_10575 [Archangium violaceum]|uniref:hypothetical protein n=1 Tax=Archangium violaceum TaxID=83451 RepID=UPI002B2AF814|nr:hypothetical protein KYC5002_10575 [Archangium gephyra]